MSNSLMVTENSGEKDPMLARHRKKWRLAFNISRAVRHVWKIANKDQDKFLNKFSPSSPYTVVDVEPQSLSTIDKLKLSKLVREKNTDYLDQFGGVQGLVVSLESHAREGIQTDVDGISHRRKAFGANRTKKPSVKVSHMLENLKDPLIAILLLCASLSLGFGLKNHGLAGVSDGLGILFSICLLNFVSSSCKIWVTRQFHRISLAKDNVFIDVTREGVRQKIPIFDVVVGDVVFLQTGDHVPADGLYIHGDSLQVNETELIEEADFDITSGNDFCYPFLLAGSNVTGGNARMLVTAVGKNTKFGDMGSCSMSYVKKNTTPLQEKLHELTRFITKVGLAVAFLVFVVLLIRYFTGHFQDNDDVKSGKTKKSTRDVCKALVGILTTPIVIATTTIPEGLSLAISVTLAYSIKRMAADQARVRNLSSCEALGRVTVICTDKRGIISINSPKVNQFWFGFKKYNSINESCSQIAEDVLQLVHEGIGLNSAACESFPELTEDQTKEAVSSWCVQQLGLNVNQLKENCCVLNEENLNLKKTPGRIFLQRNKDNTIHVHMRGSPEKILAMCSHYYLENSEKRNMNNSDKALFEGIVQEMKDGAIHSIAYAHARISDEYLHPKQGEKGITLIGILGLKDPCRPNTRNAISKCKKAGVNVIMVTTEDVLTAKASAIECGILSPGENPMDEDIIIDATRFQGYTDEERLEKVEKFSVLANASACDKLLMIRCLKQKGQVVAVTHGHLVEEIVLKEADLVFSCGTQGTHKVKEKDIIILDMSFNTIEKALRWGRGMYNNIQMYTQFQLTATISSMVIDSVSTMFTREPPTINIVTAITAGKVPLAALQLLWVKLIVGTLVAVALTADDPAENIMRLTIIDPKGPFITDVMRRTITVQALSQIMIILFLQFTGESSFNLNSKEKDTLIFNTFVLCQILNIFNTVKGRNIFEGIKGKRVFWLIIIIILVVQVVIVELLKKFADTERLNWGQWRACIGITILSSLIGWLLERISVITCCQKSKDIHCK